MKLRLLPVLLVLALCAACGGPGRLVELSPTQTRVAMTTGNFFIEPAQIVARVGTTLMLEVHNDSRFGHNFTVEDPAGRVIHSEEMAPGATVQLEVPLTREGVYPYYCAHTMHPTLGMRGRIEAR